MKRYTCTPYRAKDDLENDGPQFFVRSHDGESAAKEARYEAAEQGYEHVFVEDDGGLMIYDGPVEDRP